MSCGLPVVAYDCIAGPRDIIQDGNNGYLIPLFDKELFREKLCRLMNDENLIKEYGDNAQRSIRRYDAVTISEQYYNFITAKNEKTSCN
jgi:GalNAc-alpha-(1->4)-GalNAc-alpha-(1->3)-diNAcBac-PP-undecaprenol alpha-1,4-N-acetyl-D-galactosaminyltransferase